MVKTQEKDPVAVNNQVKNNSPELSTQVYKQKNYNKKEDAKAMIDLSDCYPQSLIDAYWEAEQSIYAMGGFGDEGVCC